MWPRHDGDVDGGLVGAEKLDRGAKADGRLPRGQPRVRGADEADARRLARHHAALEEAAGVDNPPAGDVDDVGNGDGNEYDNDDSCSRTIIYYAIYPVGV